MITQTSDVVIFELFDFSRVESVNLIYRLQEDVDTYSVVPIFPGDDVVDCEEWNPL